MKNKKVVMVLAILLLAVGFATLTTTLVINGTINIKPNTDNFQTNVKFKTATLTEGTDSYTAGDDGVTNVSIATDGKSITFTTKTLNTIGDTSVLTYTIENGSQYSATIGSVTCGAATTGTNYDSFVGTGKYVTITPANTLNTTSLAAGATSTTDTVTVAMIKSYAGVEGEGGNADVAVSFKCTLNAQAS